MKYFQLFLILPFLLLSCKEENKSIKIETEISTEEETPTEAEIHNNFGLVLTGNALQVIDKETGSTRAIEFGMQMEQLIETINKITNTTIESQQVNRECGAGPLKMVTWENNLTVVFQKENITQEDSGWEFAGWFVDEITNGNETLTTMSGLGVGSTKAELEDVYVVEFKNTNLGTEFSTEAGLYGILSGTGPDAEIEIMWSGLSCNFR